MRWGLLLGRTAAAMEVTAPWPFCTCAILVKSHISTFLLTMTRLFLTPSCSHSSFPKMKKLLLTQVFPSLTFSLPICPDARLSAACTYHSLSKLRCLSILPNYPSSFPYLTLPAAPKTDYSRLPSTQRCLQYPPPLQSSSTFISTTSRFLQNGFIFLWRQKAKLKFAI